MRESTKMFFEDLNKQFHNDTIDMQKLEEAAKERKALEESWQQKKEAKQAEEKAVRDYLYGLGPDPYKGKSDEALKEMLKGINKQFEDEARADKELMIKVNDAVRLGGRAKEIELEAIDKLIEIERGNKESIHSRIELYAAHNEIEEVRRLELQEAEIDKKIADYRSRLEKVINPPRQQEAAAIIPPQQLVNNTPLEESREAAAAGESLSMEPLREMLEDINNGDH